VSTTATATVSCPACGVEQGVLVVESANVQRFPAFREQLLAGTFMRFRCPKCGTAFVIERQLFYTDLEARLFIGVFPRGERAHADEYALVLEAAYRQAFEREPPPVVRSAVGELQRRIVFGYEELREKVVCFGAGLDDRTLEAVKLALTERSPTLGRLFLQSAGDDALSFRSASGEALIVERTVYREMYADADRLRLLLPSLWIHLHVSVDRCVGA
jgi:predicted RNA-binding Zn-ribbon protein involved in translation (DUF1610 family)